MDFKDYANMVDQALDRYLPSASRSPKVIHKAMRYSVFSGGKRIRPAIVLEAARACGAGRAEAMPAACAVELVHTYSLVHDDLPSMDDDDYRRGKPSCHKVFGEALAVLTGDALLTLAFNIMAQHIKEDRSAMAISVLSEAIGTSGMVGGQVLDIEQRPGKTSAAALRRINIMKTARLFEACAKLGAVSAASSAGKIKAMAGYGRHLGMAFQIVDDILDGDSYSRLLGAARSRCEAAALIDKAKRSLEAFGTKAEILRNIADRVLAQIQKV